jgi:hypothetical protein
MLTKKHFKLYIRDLFWNNFSLYKPSTCAKLSVSHVKVSMHGVKSFPWYYHAVILSLLSSGGPTHIENVKRKGRRVDAMYCSNVNKLYSYRFFFINSHYVYTSVFLRQVYRPRMSLSRVGSTIYKFDFLRCFWDHNMRNFYGKYFKEYFYIIRVFFFGGINRRFVIEILKFLNIPALVKLRFYYKDEPKRYSLYRRSFQKKNY